MEEACQILNITKEADLEKLTKVRSSRGWNRNESIDCVCMCLELWAFIQCQRHCQRRFILFAIQGGTSKGENRDGTSRRRKGKGQTGSCIFSREQSIITTIGNQRAFPPSFHPPFFMHVDNENPFPQARLFATANTSVYLTTIKCSSCSLTGIGSWLGCPCALSIQEMESNVVDIPSFLTQYQENEWSNGTIVSFLVIINTTRHVMSG